MKPLKRGGVVRQHLANFTAQIIREAIHDDGAAKHLFLGIEGRLSNGTDLPTLTVAAEDFLAMSWLSQWGCAAIIEPGLGMRERLRCAIQDQSSNVIRSQVVAHLGWREDESGAAFYHAGGAIGAKGVIPDVVVEVPNELKRFVLSPPPIGEELRVVTRATLQLLSIGPFKIMMPILGTVFRAIVGGADFTVHLVGRTGTFKTAVVALAQAHFGRDLDAEHLAASWLSTSNSLERLAFLAKDVLLAVDDFAPAGSRVDVQRQHREGERLLRAQGNLAGRGRMSADGKLQSGCPPRGIILSTGEDVPGGQSARARAIVIEVSPGEIDAAKLTEAQRNASNGLFAATMAAVIQWLAPRLDIARKAVRESTDQWRSRSSTHRRTPNSLGQLAAGFDLLLQFAAENGVLDQIEFEDLRQRAENALLELGETQRAHQVAADPVDRFLALLVAALASGKAHIAGANDSSRPPLPHPERYGWGRKRTEPSPDSPPIYDPRGPLIGWRRRGSLFLEPETAFEVAQSCARGQGESISVSSRTLWKRLDEKGLLVAHDRDHLTSKVMIAGSRLRVLYLRDETLFPSADADGTPARKRKKARSGDADTARSSSNPK